MGKILVVNDDGILAPGIKALVEIGLSESELLIVAPERERSGAGHSITIKTPIFYKERKDIFNHFSYKAYEISGMPADCTKMGLFYFSKPEEIDMVISGINNGLNVGIDIFYSGTIAGAREGAFAGKKAISVSSYSGSKREDFEKVAKIIKELIPILREEKENFLLNLNFPDNFKRKIEICSVANEITTSAFEKRETPYGNKPYVWLSGGEMKGKEGSDIFFTAEGKITASFLKVFPSSYEKNISIFRNLNTKLERFS